MTSARRVALVTGASRGIGREIALRFGAEGYRVVVHYRDHEAQARDVAAEVEARGGEARLARADVGDAAQVNAMVEGTIAAWGQIDVLVNNAGIARDSLILRMKDEAWDEVLAVDLRGAFLCVRAVLRSMLRQRYGRIVNMTSAAGRVGNVGQANYVAAKAGLIGLTKAVAREVAGRGITCNAVAPGLIETDMTASMDEATRERLLVRVPMGRLGTAAEVADVVMFLARPESGYITGQVIGVDGGLVMD